MTVNLPPPADWQDFERLSLDVFRHYWQDPWAERHGRSGQPQAGVDISGHMQTSGARVGVQCKKKQSASGIARAGNSLKEAEILVEARMAVTFAVPLDVFIVATTGPRDEEIQGFVAKLNAKNEFAFQIVLWFWDDFEAQLNPNRELMYRYFENVLKYREEYVADEHYFEMLAMAFDRPAIRTPVHLETRVTDLQVALSNTLEAMATGVLKDREKRVIDECRRPKGITKDLNLITSDLQRAWNCVNEGLVSGAIVEHSGCTEIRDPRLAHKINEARRSAVGHLNALLRKRDLDPVVWDGSI